MNDQILPSDLKYTREHEWLKIEGREGLIGITDYAQSQLGDVVYVELPTPGTTFAQADTFGVVESVKAVSDLYMPIGGQVVAKNDTLLDNPEKINENPYGNGWIIKIEVDTEYNTDDLLDAEQYEKLVNDLHP